LTEEVLDFAEGIGIIKSYNMLGEKSRRLTDEFEKSCKESIDFEVAYAPWARALYLTFGIGTALVLALCAYLFNAGRISDVYMVGMALFLFDLFVSIKSYYGQMARLTVTSASLDRIEEVFAAKELDDGGKKTLRPASDSDNGPYEIEYDNVTFGYTEKDVLKKVSFSVKKGQMTALVGPSGGGKSTIASLLARFWDVKSGRILVRGEDIRDVSLGNLMDQVSMVFQRVYLFQDTIYNNIAISRPDATREEVLEAAKKARCYDFIMQLPEGFDTVIGEGGASLSGGEKQRISIARCILKDSPIVILDEATASVDADNERAIQEAISELCKDKTLLVIAHRLKTIKDADQILVVSDGEIIERGDHVSLINENGTYANMVSLQNK
jgi:ATP-binding cassette subfamily B protein